MKRLSRHTVVVLLVALVSSAGGLTLAVVAFGQSDGSLSPYATTPTTTTPTTPAATTPTKTSTTPSEATTTNGANPERKHGTTVPSNNGGPPPSRATRKGPSHLAFTGGEPIYVGFFGAALMVGGFMLHRRRRAATDR
jgi:septal ring-binding cell division protein DamX